MAMSLMEAGTGRKRRADDFAPAPPRPEHMNTEMESSQAVLRHIRLLLTACTAGLPHSI
ncbi:hypothetical protein RA307_14000 [Xanthobacteraceae bacterium Astr-EGSB]|uniref:hypothetical protein n=1 Tax=Astrobacterium formosum TaxID=3069710 RepID=UPI0027B5936E|nr:hypothetical protein [Xanthobacteraceae bacterium Astr-EGSB]